MIIEQYIENVNNHFRSRIAGEHTYRGDLETLIKKLVKGVSVTNEPLHVTDCGNPDYVITRGKIPVGYIEAKDIGKDLNSNQHKEQFTRYKKALDNLIITDYVWFQFFQNGKLVHEIKIGEIYNGTIKQIPENFSKFETLLNNFCSHIGQTIKSSKKLAEMMADKARLLQDILERAITSDEESQENTSLKRQLDTFKKVLIHDLTPKGFADIYAQTLAYGMFAARLHDTSLDDFTRQEAAELIPKTNPFLRKLFGYIAGPDIDDRIKTTVDNLADVFRATNVDALLHNFGKSTYSNDPIIHFYETFLAKYNPKLRKARGVWYTPEPVVKFIVHAVDDILKTDFNLPDGIADRSKISIKVPVQGKKDLVPKTVHKVQILDPATGTGTFLVEVVKHIYKRFQNQQGSWNTYVDEHLIPRLNGFEILMASYSMAHLKLDMLLRETGYKAAKDMRFNIYLTNSLEEFNSKIPDLFMQELAEESTRANEIKRDVPVMCVIGNPPYAVSSSNKGEWIQNLLKDYKKNLNEKNIQPLSDDYIKFIRYGQHYIEKNGEGILAYISNNSFIDGIIHRQMRKNLLETFDDIYILDLHGNAQKKETHPDGSADLNVFDIMQGVSVNIFVKKTKSKKLAQTKHYDLYGKREMKYSFLKENSISSINWTLLENRKPEFFFVKKNWDIVGKYEQGFKIDEIFTNNNTGLNTEFDQLAIQDNKSDAENILKILNNQNADDVINQLGFNSNKYSKIENAITDIKINNPQIVKIKTKPFEEKFSIYTGKSNGIMGRPRHKIMKNFLNGKNIGLISMRQYAYNVPSYCYTFLSKEIVTSRLFISNKGYCSTFPLYLYPDKETDSIFTEKDRKPNLNTEIVKQIAEKLGLEFTNEKEETENTFSPIDILDYIYAVLHSPTFREKYKEFLKIDFPRVPYPKNKETFLQLVKLGGEIRQIHLLESPKVEEYITGYPIDGTNTCTTKIGKKDWEITDNENQLGRIWINAEQYFENIPLTAWEFYIGGYQPAQKWLKDRRGRVLNYDEINHYQKIIVALYETDRIMKEIDKIKFE